MSPVLATDRERRLDALSRRERPDLAPGWRSCGACGFLEPYPESPDAETYPLHRHHIIPRSEGGNGRRENLYSLCAECHHEVHRRMRRAA